MEDKEIEKIKNESWRAGYDCAMRNFQKENELSIKIGSAIISALDNRYEFAKQDY